MRCVALLLLLLVGILGGMRATHRLYLSWWCVVPVLLAGCLISAVLLAYGAHVRLRPRHQRSARE